MDRKKRCRNCRRFLDLNSHVRNHEYCKRTACQRARKRCWQRQKKSSDPDYRENQKNSQIKWQENNPDSGARIAKSMRNIVNAIVFCRKNVMQNGVSGILQRWTRQAIKYK